MPVINTNIPSLIAQNNLSKTQTALQTSMERLSSGLRINSSKDDAAGLAIANRMTTQINGLNQAARNANDAISLAQTADSALTEMTNNLQRIRELAVQAANSTNSSSDRAALNQEVQQRLDEIDRIATQTSFNGQRVLDGSFGSATFQVGANVGDTITLGLSTSMRSSAIGKTADYVDGTTAYDSTKALGAQGTGVGSTALGSGDLTIAVGTSDAVAVGSSSNYVGTDASQGATSAYAKVAAINGAAIGGLTATAETDATFGFASVTDNGYSLSINGTAIFSSYDASTNNLDGSSVAAAINSNTSTTGVTAAFDGTNMTLTAVDGRNIKIDQTSTTTVGVGFKAAAGSNNTTNSSLDATTATAGTAVSQTAYGTIRMTAANTITIAGNTPANAGYTATSLALGSQALNTTSVTTVANANTTLTRVDSALDAIASLRSTFGAIQNRFDSVIASTQATSQNLAAARSRIQDADFAAETASLTRAQILQQAGTAMVAQANSVPNTVLTLLR
jgi:flagellin